MWLKYKDRQRFVTGCHLKILHKRLKRIVMFFLFLLQMCLIL